MLAVNASCRAVLPSCPLCLLSGLSLLFALTTGCGGNGTSPRAAGNDEGGGSSADGSQGTGDDAGSSADSPSSSADAPADGPRSGDAGGGGSPDATSGANGDAGSVASDGASPDHFTAGSPDAAGGADGSSGGSDASSADGGTAQCSASPLGMLASTSLSVRFANSIMTRWPDPRNIGGSAHGWDYNVGIVLQGMERVFERTGDMSYVTYIQKYVDAFVDSSGAISGLPALPAGYALDTIEPGTMLLFLYQQTGLAKYQTAAAQLLGILTGAYPKNPLGGFWHKQQYPNQMWLDGIYMAEPFVLKYGTLFSSCGTFCVDTPVQQITLIAAHTEDTTTGLFYHAWDQSLMAAWANPTTGRSPSVWDRGMGWFAMAIVDLLHDLPATNSSRAQFVQWLQQMAAGIKSTQDAATGLWYQVVDMPTGTGNFIETSGSGMFIYALKAGIDNCYIDSSYLAVAQKGWTGMQAEVQTDSMGPVITNAVQGMGVQNNYAAYVNQTRLSNSGHGLCGVLMAGSQME